MAPMVEQVAEHCGHTPEECQARNRGLLRMSVRGLTKVKGVAVLFALAHRALLVVFDLWAHHWRQHQAWGEVQPEHVL